MRFLLRIFLVLYALFVAAISYLCLTSLFASVRFYVLFVFLGLNLFLVGVFLYLNRTRLKFIFKQQKFLVTALSVATLIIIFSLLVFPYNRFRFYRSDLSTNKNLIVGFRNESDVVELVKANKIAGVYLTARNVQNKSKAEIKDFIKNLQDIQAKTTNTKLLILADNEGGTVSHLSPPLTQTKSLASVLGAKNSLDSEAILEIKEIAQTQGKELEEIGVNVNLSPVADLKSELGAGGFSQINSRSISDDPKIVHEVVDIYCEELSKFDVSCTLKHFPGIGSVQEDTHFFLGTKNNPKSEIDNESQVFKSVNTPHLVMVSHTRVDNIDPDLPMSISPKGIAYLKEINPDAKIITDDFSMFPISQKYGIRKGYQMAISAGVDYVLVSYDTELGYSIF